ncbi:96ed956e-e206-4fa0-ba10-43951717436a-CDS [Sclerotinia trifoliorum]|uniref:96ed956e-e206-4fa0-ba10-43951717436a-CDS n=1 Tax=Sclerotinia trifoliorum TaxID=28548 RepID=A0A8H2ZR97_9HELO|nr:96ed956e-e206-4fa0-ba10-43951717436a-CDS [Sclerotinia trifoliorum]
MDTFEDLANLAEEFQVKTTTKFTGEPRKYRSRQLFQDTWQELTNINLDVEEKSADSKSQQSQALPSSIQDQRFAEFTLFPKLPLELRRKIWAFTVESRLIEEKYCRHFGEGHGRYWKKSVRSLFPINIVPYSSMPASFWACSESRDEVARYYEDIAAIPETRMLCEVWPQMPIEAIRSLLQSNPFSLNQAIVNFKLLCEEDSSHPLPPSVPFNPDQDIIGFESLTCVDVGEDYDLHPVARQVFHNTPLPLDWEPWRNDLFPTYQPLIIHPSIVKRVQITPRSLLRRYFKDDRFERDGLRRPYMIFIGFIYQDLNELIIQDFDCKLPHKLDSPEERELWKEWILRMFKVESAHDEYASVRAGSAFKVPKVVIRPGTKIARPCEDCSTSQKREQKRARDVKDIQYYYKHFVLNCPEEDEDCQIGEYWDLGDDS